MAHARRASARPRSAGTVTLGALGADVATGITQGRAAYADHGHFVVKVGNLTGNGVDWTPRARNFVLHPRADARSALRVGDILLTATAHHVRYIGHKVDLLTALPPHLTQPVFFSGEVMRVRVDPTILDPAALYLWLLSPEGYTRVQRLARGTTVSAHLYAEAMRGLRIDPDVIRGRFAARRCHEVRACIDAGQVLQERWRALAETCGLRKGDSS